MSTSGTLLTTPINHLLEESEINSLREEFDTVRVTDQFVRILVGYLGDTLPTQYIRSKVRAGIMMRADAESLVEELVARMRAGGRFSRIESAADAAAEVQEQMFLHARAASAAHLRALFKTHVFDPRNTEEDRRANMFRVSPERHTGQVNEYEFRFGRRSEKGAFRAGVDKAAFDRALKYVRAHVADVRDESYKVHMCTLGGRNLRVVLRAATSGGGGFFIDRIETKSKPRKPVDIESDEGAVLRYQRAVERPLGEAELAALLGGGDNDIGGSGIDADLDGNVDAEEMRRARARADTLAQRVYEKAAVVLERAVERTTAAPGDMYRLSLSRVRSAKEVAGKRRFRTTYEIEVEAYGEPREWSSVFDILGVFRLVSSRESFVSRAAADRARSFLVDTVNNFSAMKSAEEKNKKPASARSPGEVGKKVVGLDADRLVGGGGAYAVTNKLDGVNFFLVHGPFGAALVNDTAVEVLARAPAPPHMVSVLQGEVRARAFHAFDCLIASGVGVMARPLLARVEAAREVCAPLRQQLLVGADHPSGFSVAAPKRFAQTTDVLVSIDAVMGWMRRAAGGDERAMLEANDGLIFTPAHAPYLEAVSMKFKFPEKLSIDFLLRPPRDSRKKKPSSSSAAREFALFVYNKANRLVPFRARGREQTARVDDPALAAGDIAEFTWSSEAGAFVFARARPDKTKPNFVGVANRVFAEMEAPMSLAALRARVVELRNAASSPFDVMRAAHKAYKKLLIEDHARGKRVVDVGFGRGGDFMKYVGARAAHVHGIEPDAAHVAEFARRLAETFPKYILKFKTHFRGFFEPGRLYAAREVVVAGERFFVATEPTNRWGPAWAWIGRLRYAGAWAAGRPYARDDVVLHAGSMHVSLLEANRAEPPARGRWEPILDWVDALDQVALEEGARGLLELRSVHARMNGRLHIERAGVLESGFAGEADVVASFFSLTFFFGDERTLDSFVDFVSSALAPGGKFIGTTVSGKRLFDRFAGEEGGFDGEFVRVGAADHAALVGGNGPSLARAVPVLADLGPLRAAGEGKVGGGHRSIVRAQREFLVIFDELASRLRARGIELAEQQFFADVATGDRDVDEYSSMNFYFVFERRARPRSPAPEAAEAAQVPAPMRAPRAAGVLVADLERLGAYRRAAPMIKYLELLADKLPAARRAAFRFSRARAANFRLVEEVAVSALGAFAARALYHDFYANLDALAHNEKLIARAAKLAAYYGATAAIAGEVRARGGAAGVGAAARTYFEQAARGGFAAAMRRRLLDISRSIAEANNKILTHIFYFMDQEMFVGLVAGVHLHALDRPTTIEAPGGEVEAEEAEEEHESPTTSESVVLHTVNVARSHHAVHFRRLVDMTAMSLDGTFAHTDAFGAAHVDRKTIYRRTILVSQYLRFGPEFTVATVNMITQLQYRYVSVLNLLAEIESHEEPAARGGPAALVAPDVAADVVAHIRAVLGGEDARVVDAYVDRVRQETRALDAARREPGYVGATASFFRLKFLRAIVNVLYSDSMIISDKLNDMLYAFTKDRIVDEINELAGLDAVAHADIISGLEYDDWVRYLERHFKFADPAFAAKVAALRARAQQRGEANVDPRGVALVRAYDEFVEFAAQLRTGKRDLEYSRANIHRVVLDALVAAGRGGEEARRVAAAAADIYERTMREVFAIPPLRPDFIKRFADRVLAINRSVWARWTEANDVESDSALIDYKLYMDTLISRKYRRVAFGREQREQVQRKRARAAAGLPAEPGAAGGGEEEFIFKGGAAARKRKRPARAVEEEMAAIEAAIADPIGEEARATPRGAKKRKAAAKFVRGMAARPAKRVKADDEDEDEDADEDEAGAGNEGEEEIDVGLGRFAAEEDGGSLFDDADLESGDEK